jgi:hypothetical protein
MRPEIQIHDCRESYAGFVIGDSNVSFLILKEIVERINNKFVGEVRFPNDTYVMEQYALHELYDLELTGMIVNRFGVYEATCKMPHVSHEDHYRYFLLGEGKNAY